MLATIRKCKNEGERGWKQVLRICSLKSMERAGLQRPDGMSRTVWFPKSSQCGVRELDFFFLLSRIM